MDSSSHNYQDHAVQNQSLQYLCIQTTNDRPQLHIESDNAFYRDIDAVMQEIDAFSPSSAGTLAEYSPSLLTPVPLEAGLPGDPLIEVGGPVLNYYAQDEFKTFYQLQPSEALKANSNGLENSFNWDGDKFNETSSSTGTMEACDWNVGNLNCHEAQHILQYYKLVSFPQSLTEVNECPPGSMETIKRGYFEYSESLELLREVDAVIESPAPSPSNPDKSTSSKKLYSCLLCQKKEMTTRMHALDHVYTKHFGARIAVRFACIASGCPFRSMSESSTQKHCRTVHIEGKVKCPNCNSTGRKDYIAGKHAKDHCSGRSPTV
ncbi:hypothetical protein M422DRAFT_778151 [Sphaerobolus stellatus SS14]|nr:hypothetical protein M422DRAFT_778151 [Sphaerobolus stellatus SS14]